MTTVDSKQESLRQASRDRVIDALPDPDTTSLEATAVELIFIGQAWINGRAVVTDDGTCRFVVPATALRINDTWAIEGTSLNHHVADDLATHEAAPTWVREWNGPFRIAVTDVGTPPADTDDTQPGTDDHA